MSDARLPETGFLRLPEVLALFPVSRSLGPNTTAWRAEDIRRLIHHYNDSTSTRP